jgi:hypothetical protein
LEKGENKTQKQHITIPSSPPSTIPTPPIGRMIKAKAKALRDDVTLFLKMCERMNGLLPNARTFCVLIHEGKGIEDTMEKLKLKKRRGKTRGRIAASRVHGDSDLSSL